MDPAWFAMDRRVSGCRSAVDEGGLVPASRPRAEASGAPAEKGATKATRRRRGELFGPEFSVSRSRLLRNAWQRRQQRAGSNGRGDERRAENKHGTAKRQAVKRHTDSRKTG